MERILQGLRYLKDGDLHHITYQDVLLGSSVTVDWWNVRKWFDTFSAPCAKKWAHSLVYLFCVCQTMWYGMLGVCNMVGKWAGRGTEGREVHNGDNVKDIYRLGESSMWYVTLLVSIGGLP